MFPWLCNYIDVKSIENAIYSQNTILQNMIEHMDKSSFWAIVISGISCLITFILGVLTFYITYYLKELSEQQNEILKKQYNFELLKKRLFVVDKFQEIMNKAIIDPDKADHSAVWNQINDFISKSEILFEPEITKKIIEAKKAFESYHNNNKVIELFDKESNNYSTEEYIKANECAQNALNNVSSLHMEMRLRFQETLEGMLEFIRKNEI